MRQQIAVVMCSVVLGLMTFSSAAMAQQNTAKECREEWKANKAANQANGVTEKAYVAQCRGGARPPNRPGPRQTGRLLLRWRPPPQDKRARECREEWKANKAANQANGVTEKAYVAQCRGGAAPAQPTAAPAEPPAPAPTAATVSPSPNPTTAPLRPDPLPAFQQIRLVQTNFQPKLWLRDTAPLILLFGLI